ncbi:MULTISPECIES: amino acid adenylation domain-containing protein [unclassified Streptomyces]|uniref:amino acid adenylation domain-containing protein n=1 Tax=unclassified Streptomyces TaxID=2593676 RepID=UPI00061F34A7|nr:MULTISPECIES: amino acid adenylation domain-containing protein [unclassified Streptomyces]KJY47996.1 peptide synthetase [Streptomyces sp. NRRL S-444]TDU69048.1 amino acid adenylation domain-containing protein [Streptomyces sp. KS 21]THA33285.1 amino acid adenylation domain-containing protein [Streptomyces sp. A1547]
MSLIGRRLALPPDLLVHRVFETHARQHPDRPALTCGAEELSYAELNARANRFAHHLIALGAGRGSVIGVCLDRTPELMVAILGTMKAGAAYVPLDPTYPAERLHLMVSQLDEIKLNVVSADTRALVAGAPGDLVVIDELGGQLDALPVTDPVVDLSNDDLCYVVFTSGSTGTPKATAVRHEGWYNLLEWLRVEYGLGSGSSGLTVSSFGFDISQRGLMAPLFCGATLHLLPSRIFDPGMAYRLIETHGVRQLHCAPSTLYVLIEHEQALGTDALTRVGHVFIGGEPLTVSRVEDWAGREGNSCVLLHQYGVAECTDVATSHVLADYARYRGTATPVGEPVYNTEIHLLDEESNEVPDGETGEICISGLSVSAGYLNASPADTRRFTDRATGDGTVRTYRTGDRGYVTPDGELVVVGRVDAQVKIRGMRMDLGDVEHGVRSHPLVDDAVVLAVPDDSGELRLVGFVLPAADGLDTRALYRDLLGTLPRNMVPQDFTVLDAFPLNPNGKTDRRALAALAAG